MSVGMTAVMSLLFHRSIHYDMIATGFICALVIDRIINRISGHYRQRLAAANETLERRVHERTAELRDANLALRQAAAAEAALRDELIARDRMATAGQLAAGVSHEIRSPLSVITLVVAELEAQLPAAQPEVGALIADISDSAERIALILRDLSSLARPIDDPLAPVDLDAALASAGRLAAYKLDKGAT
ncbi:MAG: hypothetical protein JST92_05980, partial [Deltaproteobacteria bacterium]|nr:hypothetical protein [Deltaproteobacteria bacterium]